MTKREAGLLLIGAGVGFILAIGGVKIDGSMLLSRGKNHKNPN
jgi:hypothetical protein